MKALGIIRPIDKLGRVVIPIEVRRAQGWVEGTPMEMFASEDGLVMREYGNPHEELLEMLAAISEMDLSQDFIDKANKMFKKYDV